LLTCSCFCLQLFPDASDRLSWPSHRMARCLRSRALQAPAQAAA
jgi:hypothetical protein